MMISLYNTVSLILMKFDKSSICQEIYVLLAYLCSYICKEEDEK